MAFRPLHPFTTKKTCPICHGVGNLNGVFCEVCKGSGISYKKYNNKKVLYNGELYDSQKEANKAMELDLLKRAGEVLDWRPHPKFVILPRCTIDGKIQRPITYTPDFWIKYKDGREEVVDTKGFYTEVSKVKAKMWRYKYKDSPMKLVIE